MFILAGGVIQLAIIAAAWRGSRRLLWLTVVTGSFFLVGVSWYMSIPIGTFWIGPLLCVLTAELMRGLISKRRYEAGVFDERVRLTRDTHRRIRASAHRVKNVNEVLEQNVLDVASLYELTKSMNTSLEFVDIFEIFSGTLRRTFVFEAAKLILLRPDEEDGIDRIYQIQKIEGQNPVIPREEKRRITLIDRELRSHPNVVGIMNFDREIANEVRRIQGPLFVSKDLRQPRGLKLQLPKDVRSFIATPLRFEGRLLGVLTMENFSDEVFEKFAILAGQLSMEIKKAKLYETIQELALIDGLTGVFRRKHFLERYTEEFSRSRKRELTLSVLMLDLDWFKKYNDEHGHLVGDSALREVARLTKENLREVDLLGRLGGEEFCVALPETGKSEAHQVAERIRSSIESCPFTVYDAVTRMTVSIGVAAFPTDADKPQRLIECADEALYQSKRKGRNRVSTYRE